MQTLVTVSGYLAETPKISYTANTQKALATLKVGVKRRTKNPATETWEDAEPTIHTVKVWGPRAEILNETIKVGAQVLMFGTLETESWIDKDTKTRRHQDVIVINERTGDIGLSYANTLAAFELPTQTENPS